MNKRKLLLVGGGIIGTSIVAMSLFGKGVVHTSIVIPASTHEVWSVLSETQTYNEWNPVLVPEKGELKQGSELIYQMTDYKGNTSKVKAEVIEKTENKRLVQFGGIKGILTFKHSWILESVDRGTLVTQHEEYRGIGVWFWDYEWVESAYSSANKALKQRVEQLFSNRGLK